MRNKGHECSVDDCHTEASKLGMCDMHYQQARTRGDTAPRQRFTDRKCSYPGCERRHKRYGWCDAHSRQASKVGGDVTRMSPIRVGRAHRLITAQGYAKVYRPEHPNAQGKGWVNEHTLVMSEHLDRPLLPHENVHHINGQRADNRLGNLELWSSKQPRGQRVDDKVEFAIEILQLYRPELLT